MAKEQIDKYSNCFDAIRYILALLITMAHYCELSETHFLQGIDIISNRVSIFFIISGFFSMMMYSKIPDPKHFAIKRLRRLLPAYWLTIILSACLLSLFSDMNFSDFWTNKQTYSYLIANLSFANFLEPGLPGVFANNYMSAVNGALWTMKVELMLLITVPFAYWLMNKIGRNKTLVLIFILSTLYRISMNNLYNITQNEIYNILGRQMGGQLVYFYSGAAVYFYREYILSKGKIILPISILGYLLHTKNIWFGLVAPINMALIITILVFKCKYLFGVGRLPNISYSIYLVHFPIIQTFVHLGLHKFFPLGTLLLSLFTTIVFGYIMWYIAERPFMHKNVCGEQKK